MQNDKGYFFKLNVQPHILEKFRELNYLKNKVIPGVLSNLYDNLFNPVENKENGTLVFSLENSYSQILKSTDYENLIEITNYIAIMYGTIVKKFENREGIQYSQEFLDTLDKAKQLRKEFVKKYGVIEQNLYTFSKTVIDDSLENNYKISIKPEVGKGLDHLRRIERMKLYFEKMSKEDSDTIRVSYLSKDEFFIISESNTINALYQSKLIEKTINESGSELEEVTINPVFEKIVLNKEKFSSIEIFTTYPNGSTKREYDILTKLLKITGGKESKTKIISSEKTNGNFENNIEKIINEPGGKGYLRDIKINGESGIDYTKSELRVG